MLKKFWNPVMPVKQYSDNSNIEMEVCFITEGIFFPS
jgi:hypothetical protein